MPRPHAQACWSHDQNQWPIITCVDQKVNSLSALRPASRFVNYNKNCSPFLDQEINRLSLVIVCYFLVTKFLEKILWKIFGCCSSLPCLCAHGALRLAFGFRSSCLGFFVPNSGFKSVHLFAWNFGKTNLKFLDVVLVMQTCPGGTDQYLFTCAFYNSSGG